MMVIKEVISRTRPDLVREAAADDHTPVISGRRREHHDENEIVEPEERAGHFVINLAVLKNQGKSGPIIAKQWMTNAREVATGKY